MARLCICADSTWPTLCNIKKNVANVANVVGVCEKQINVELIEVHIEVHKLLVRNSFSTN